jgi:O-antigen/teichoic acid export membrane protein
VTILSPKELSQKGRLWFLLKDSALYGGAAAISKSFALITFPVLARNFSVIEFGVLDYFIVLSGFLVTFFVFGQDSAVARYFYEYEDIDNRRNLISQSILFQLTGLLLITPFLWLYAESICDVLIESPNGVVYFRIVLLQLPFLLLINYSKNLLKWTFARKQFLIMSLGFTMIHITLLIVAVVFFQIGIAGVLIVTLVTSVIFGVLGLFFVRDWLILPSSYYRLKEMLPYAIPVGIIGIVGAFSPTLERTLINNMLGTDQLGLYAAASKIAMLIGLLVSAFQTAWGPFSLSLYKQTNAGQTYNWVLKLFVFGVCLASLIITLLAKPVIQILATERYYGASVIVFPLVMGLAIQATSWITEIGIGISKRTYLSLYSNLIALVGTLIGIWYFTYLFGLLGVALGVLIGQILKALSSTWLSQMAFNLPWEFKPVITLLLTTLITGLTALWVEIEYGFVMKNTTLLIGLILVFIIGWRLFLNNKERRLLLGFYRNLFYEN